MLKVNVRRLADGIPYDAPNHFGVEGFRLQGLDAGGAEALWVGFSRFPPGASAGPDAGGIEKVYVVLSGQMTLRSEGQTVVLEAHDSVTIPAGVEREIKNEAATMATMLVILPRVVG